MEPKNKNITVKKNKEGVERLFMDNYTYGYHSKTNTEHKWLCSYKKTLSCKAAVVTKLVDGLHELKTPPTKHCHLPIRIMQDTSHFLGGVLHVSMEVPLMPAESKRKRKSDNRPQIFISDMLAGKMMKVDVDTEVMEEPDKAEPVVKTPRIKKRRPEIDAEIASTENNVSQNTVDNEVGGPTGIASGPNAESDPIVPKDTNDLTAATEKTGSQPDENKPKDEEQTKSALTDEPLVDEEAHISPAAKAHVLKTNDLEDGTVSVQLFVEKNLLSSFVINSQFTSNVNIRIAKDAPETVAAASG